MAECGVDAPVIEQRQPEMDALGNELHLIEEP
jgi:hypothetical protein